MKCYKNPLVNDKSNTKQSIDFSTKATGNGKLILRTYRKYVIRNTAFSMARFRMNDMTFSFNERRNKN